VLRGRLLAAGAAAAAALALAAAGCGSGGDGPRAVPHSPKELRAAVDAAEHGFDSALATYRDGDRVKARDRIRATYRNDVVPLTRALGPEGARLRAQVTATLDPLVDQGAPVSALAKRLAALEAALDAAARRAGAR
jgi:gamma-glutamyl:cysteine ligase YbdK (ATP-grasp superfamily)